MRHHIYTLDDYDPEPDSEVIMVKVIPGTYEEQLASLTERLANIDRWLERMSENGGTLHGGFHSTARFEQLLRRRDHVAEHAQWLDTVLTVMTPDPEPPTNEELEQWHQERFRAEWGDELEEARAEAEVDA